MAGDLDLLSTKFTVETSATHMITSELGWLVTEKQLTLFSTQTPLPIHIKPSALYNQGSTSDMYAWEKLWFFAKLQESIFWSEPLQSGPPTKISPDPWLGLPMSTMHQKWVKPWIWTLQSNSCLKLACDYHLGCLLPSVEVAYSLWLCLCVRSWSLLKFRLQKSQLR